MTNTLSPHYHPHPSYPELASYPKLANSTGGELSKADTNPPQDNPFYDPVLPADFPQAILRYRNQRAAISIGLDNISNTEWIRYFKEFEPLPNNLPRPLAIRYHGHQFRHYNTDIGDGRGFLYAQLKDQSGRLLDLGTKGSGQTPYSRSGDGRLTLKGGVREILATEMLEAMGVYTSKTLSIIETGEALYRSDEPSPARSCVMVRLSHSHLRFGIFQRLAYEKNPQALERLVNYCIKYYFPDLATLEGDDKVCGFYERVIANTARLTSQWLAAGFVHGVLNTDNMNITGESFDYGPWRFVDVPIPGFTAAYFDQTGLYAYGRQGEAAGWNLAQLGGTLTLLTNPEKLTACLEPFPEIFARNLEESFLRRLGLKNASQSQSGLVQQELAMPLLKAMAANSMPFEQVMFDWFGGPNHKASKDRHAKSPLAQHYKSEDFALIKQTLEQYEPQAPERLEHPYFAHPAPCTMLIEEVESLWLAISDDDNWHPFEKKLNDISEMREAYGFKQGA